MCVLIVGSKCVVQLHFDASNAILLLRFLPKLMNVSFNNFITNQMHATFAFIILNKAPTAKLTD